MVIAALTEENVWAALQDVADPEIPVLSVVDMRIVRSVEVDGDGVKVEITPTFSGCPALEFIQENIRTKLLSLGFKNVVVRKNMSKSWSSDLLDTAARNKLRSFGIAPPAVGPIVHENLMTEEVECPFCHSVKTHLESSFGATLCKQLYYCDACRQSFERFKRL